MFLSLDLNAMPRIAALICVSVLATGCVNMTAPSYYDPPKPSSTQDAIMNAEGAGMRQVVVAPSQIQLGWQTGGGVDQLTPAGQQAIERDVAADEAPVGLIPKPETFMGNLPCFGAGMNCATQRVVVTLAPNGRWRSRITYLDQQQQTSGKPSVAQGCWRSTLATPPSLLLLDAQQNVRTELRMTANNLLQVVTIDGNSPSLAYTLNRQPDLDPISELDKVAAPVCR
jgi:hypothetical protein